jgi:hypothetical protein
LGKLLELGDREGKSEEEVASALARFREKVYRRMIAPKHRSKP